jgi:hypothetical protein
MDSVLCSGSHITVEDFLITSVMRLTALAFLLVVVTGVTAACAADCPPGQQSGDSFKKYLPPPIPGTS